MQELQIDEIKKLEVEILTEVATFCDQHNLRYYLCGGTLIGAVRHKGFIPWDDDIDVSMPRPDYDIFINSFHCEKEYIQVFSCQNKKDYWRTHCQVFDTRTVVVEDSYRQDIAKDNAVFIDLYPIEGMPSSPIKQKLYWAGYTVLHAVHYASILNNTKSHHFGEEARFKNFIRTVIKSVLIGIFRWFDYRTVIRICEWYAKLYSFEESEYVAIVAENGDFGIRGITPKAIYKQALAVPFENAYFKIPGEYDYYLRKVYGDYMQLPPECDRIYKHSFDAFWKEYN